MRIFIVGVGRSGTSLLQSMLASHPGVHAFPETSFLRRYPFSCENMPGDFFDDGVLARVPGFSEKLAQLGSNVNREALIDAYSSVFVDEKGLPVLDKDPRLVEYIPLLYSSFGADAKVVHIFRDPRDVLASKKKAAWSSGRSLIEYLVASCVQLRDARKAEKENGILSIRYESLIKDPQSQLKVVLDYIGLPFDDAVLNHTDAAKFLVHDSELSWKEETFRPVNANNSGKWSKDLSLNEALASSLIAKRFFKYKGIDLVDPEAVAIDHIWAAFTVLIARSLAAVYIMRRFFRRKSKGVV